MLKFTGHHPFPSRKEGCGCTVCFQKSSTFQNGHDALMRTEKSITQESQQGCICINAASTGANNFPTKVHLVDLCPHGQDCGLSSDAQKWPLVLINKVCSCLESSGKT